MNNNEHMINHDTGGGLDFISISLCGITLLFSWLSQASLSSIATGAAAVAAISTIVYNVIKIVKEVYKK